MARRKNRALGGIPRLNQAQHERRVRELRAAGCQVTLVRQPYGTVVLKQCPPGARVRSLGDVAVEASRKSGSKETGGWAPGWARAGTFKNRGAAEHWIKTRGLRGANYRIKTLDGCGCDF